MEEQPWENVSYGDTVSLFGTASSGLSPSFTVLDGSATIEGDQLTVTGAGKITPKCLSGGTQNFLPAGPVQFEFIAEKALLTVSADDAERGFQDPNPSFTLSYSGFKFADTLVDIDAKPIATAYSGAELGDYPITPSGGSDSNYNFSFRDGTLIVNELRRQTITFPEIPDLQYGDFADLLAASDSGLPIIYEVRTLESTGSAQIVEGKLEATGVGKVTIRASQYGDKKNFNPASPIDRTFE